MGDLTNLEATEAARIVGSQVGGTETNPLAIDSDQRALTRSVVQGGAKGTTPFGGDITSESVTPNQQALHVAILASDGATNKVEVRAREDSGFSPDTSSHPNGKLVTLRADAYDNLRTRGQVLVDEGSIRDDFIGSSLLQNLSGTTTFVNGSAIVTGVGTSFLSEAKLDSYVKLAADGTQFLAQIKSVDTDTQITLYSPYLGAGGSGIAQMSNWKYSFSGTGASISVGSSLCTLAAGTASGAKTSLERGVDYAPLFMYFDLSISQRISNQTITVGLVDDTTNPTKGAVVIFDGTNPSQLIFRTFTSASPNDKQETTVVLPGGKSTLQRLDYEINLTGTSASLVVEGQTRAIHTDSIPGPYDIMKAWFSTLNSGVVTDTNVDLHVAYIQSINQIQITNSFKGEPLKVQMVGAPGSTISGFSDGKYRNTSSLAETIQVAPTRRAVRDGENSPTAIPYSEQTTDAQRSIVSSSANDAAAGTGARTVRITYYDQNGIGPFYETVILNGTTAVNTVNTNICFIEKMEVITVGSLGYAAGNIQLKTTIGGGGTNIGAILLGSTRTFWCHHYVAAGYTLYITSATVATTGTVAGNGGTFFLAAKQVGVANAVDRQVGDTIRVPGSVSTNYRGYDTPVEVIGPARVTGYVSNTAGATYECFMSFSYYEA